MIKKTLSPRAALVKLEELCARSEQSSGEILDRCRRWGIPSATAEKILARLRQGRYVDDSRFAQAFVRDKVVFNRWGRSRLRLALYQKGVDRDLIDQAIDTIDPDEYSAALTTLLTDKARLMADPTSYDSRMKLLRYAISRGFEAPLALSILKSLPST